MKCNGGCGETLHLCRLVLALILAASRIDTYQNLIADQFEFRLIDKENYFSNEYNQMHFFYLNGISLPYQLDETISKLCFFLGSILQFHSNC